MMERKKRIAIDLDNVIWDLSTPWVKAYNALFDDNVDPDNLPVYSMSEIMTKATHDEIYGILGCPAIWAAVDLIPGAYSGMQELMANYDVYIVTKTDYRTVGPKFTKLLDLLPFLTREQLIIAHDKSLVDCDLWVDDNPDFLPEGKKGIIFDWPYNRYCQDRPRVYDWAGLVRAVETLL